MEEGTCYGEPGVVLAQKQSQQWRRRLKGKRYLWEGMGVVYPRFRSSLCLFLLSG